MVPILSSIIVGQGATSNGRNLQLTLTYVLAMAVTYAALGMVVGAFGGALNLHGWLQSPGVLMVFAALFALLALAMFDVYTLELPGGLQQWLGAPREGGSLGSVALLGVLSSLLVSPCVSAPLPARSFSSVPRAMLSLGDLRSLPSPSAWACPCCWWAQAVVPSCPGSVLG